MPTPRSPATVGEARGLGFTAGLDPPAARVVAAIEAARPAGACIDRLAADVEMPVEEPRAAGRELVRRLLELGFVEPA